LVAILNHLYLKNNAMKTLKMRHIRLAIAACVLLCGTSAAHAQSMRLTQGKPCLPNEKTYYDQDGVTTFGCESAGGPTYRFEVHANGTLVWEGLLPGERREVLADLPALSEGAKSSQESPYAKMVARRCVELDPAGDTFFFGERHLTAIKTFEGGGSRLSLPETTDRGVCVPAPQSARDYQATTSARAADGSSVEYRVNIKKL
jgi:hypothetical protein